jgi:glycosyltransferase involved in cell wall biosynthesis
MQTEADNAVPQSVLPQYQVVIVQQVLKQYRLAFFDGLAAELAKMRIKLTVLFGVATGAEAEKADNISVAPASHYQVVAVNRYGPFVWQWHPLLAQADVIIVEQANRHLLNYWLLWLRRRRDFRLLFWGHGYDHQQVKFLQSRWKQYWLNACDHFLAYTDPVAAWLQQQGLPGEKITVLHNSLDTSALLALQRPRPEPVVRPLVLLFSGALYPAKQLPLLLQSCAVLYQQKLISRLIVLGDGPERDMLQQWAATAPWLDYRGACFADAKTQAYLAADLVLNPGLTGLAILDAFAAGLPYLTTLQPDHSPELCYLRHGFNGYLLQAEVPAIVAAVKTLQQDPQLRAALGEQARVTATQYSLKQMVHGALRAIAAQLPDQAGRRVKVLHQAYRTPGGEDQVVARELALLAALPQEISADIRQTPQQIKPIQQLQALAGWFGCIVDLLPLQGLRRGDLLIVHNLFPLMSPFLLTAARRRGIKTMLYLHNLRLLTPAASLSAGETATAPGWSLLWQQIKTPARQEGRLVSLLLSLALCLQYRLKVWQQADVLLCPSNFIRQQFLAAGVAPALLQVKPHYVPAPALSETEPAVPPYLLFVGRPEVSKGFRFLQEIWRQVPGLPQLWVAGAGTAGQEETTGVRFLGWQDQTALSRLYQQAQLVLVPSIQTESFGNVVIEAYAHGTPVLAANIGALTELVVPSQTGMLFQSGDSADFLTRLQQLLADPAGLILMGQQARARYQLLYSLQAQHKFYD